MTTWLAIAICAGPSPLRQLIKSFPTTTMIDAVMKSQLQKTSSYLNIFGAAR